MHVGQEEVERPQPEDANAFDANTMNCSWLTARTAGTESTAKMTSVASISTSTANSGVASRLPFCFVNSFGPVVLGRRRDETVHQLQEPGVTGSIELSLPNTSLAAVYSRNAPNRYRIQSNFSINATPAKMKMARRTSAPKIPQNSTRC